MTLLDIRIDAAKRDPLDNIRGPRLSAPKKRGPKPGSKNRPRTSLPKARGKLRS